MSGKAAPTIETKRRVGRPRFRPVDDKRTNYTLALATSQMRKLIRHAKKRRMTAAAVLRGWIDDLGLVE